MEALKYHPKGAEKMGSGIREIKVFFGLLLGDVAYCYILIIQVWTSRNDSYYKISLANGSLFNTDLRLLMTPKSFLRIVAYAF